MNAPLTPAVPRRIAFVHTGSYFHLATLKDPAVVALDVADVYAPELEPGGLDGYDSVYVAARLHPAVRQRVVPVLLDFAARAGARIYIDGENEVGEWLPGTTEIRRGTNFWAWRIGEDVGRRVVNEDHPFWRRLSPRSVHWHYHGVLAHPVGAVPLVVLEELAEAPEQGAPAVAAGADPWGLDYRAVPDHPNTVLYYDAETFPAEMVVSTMDASYHHGAGFMPGASQLLYRMFRWLGE
ncbi:MAG TPA: hypothetical protein VFC72_06595 [Corynebacterium sp.]|nr:hypothetical protein [Corynebacterium sp.]